MAIWSRLQGTMFGVGIGAAARDAVAPVLETARQSSYGQRAVYVLNAATAARASVRGIADKIDPYDDAKRQGLGRNRFDILKALEVTFPGTDQVLQWYRRNPLQHDEAVEALRRLGYNTEWTGRILSLRDVRPPVTDLIRMAVREVFSPALRAELKLDEDFPETMVPQGESVGLNRQTQLDYWAAHWDLPSFTQLQEMLFRTDLDEAGFKRALRALDYSPAWRDRLFKISYRIPTLTDMVRFAVREAYDDGAAQAQGLDLDYPPNFTAEAAKHGLQEPDAKRYWRAHWRYPSPQQAYQMLHRNIIDSTQLSALLKILDYPKPWRDRLEKLAYLRPGRIDLRRMYAAGVISEAETLAGYQHLGYTDEWARRLTDFAKVKPDSTRESYPEKARTQFWSTTHRSFLAALTPEAEARDNLVVLGLSADDRDEVIELWTFERDTTRKQLTPAQVKKAYQEMVENPATGLPWTYEDALVALIERGFSSNDAETYLKT